MLMLSRQAGEKIIIAVAGERIEVVYLGMRNGQARIGIDADRDRVHVLRGELVGDGLEPKGANPCWS